VHELNAKRVTLKATEQPVDTGSTADEAFRMTGRGGERETGNERLVTGMSRGGILAMSDPTQ
jgi:hypothetical protein